MSRTERRGRSKGAVSGEARSFAERTPPQLADEDYTLMTTGRLTPEQQRPPGMKCVRCKEHAMTLILLHPPVTNEQLADRWFEAPSLVWGEDVACICPCCSFAGCPHGERRLKVMA